MRSLASLLFLILVALPSDARAQDAPTQKKKKVKYKQHTELDLTGTSVEGKARAPEIFYIFQRKRSKGHDAVSLPEEFPDHQARTIEVLRKTVSE